MVRIMAYIFVHVCRWGNDFSVVFSTTRWGGVIQGGQVRMFGIHLWIIIWPEVYSVRPVGD